jgi:HEAT repeat protein
VEWLLAALADPNVNVRYDATIALTRLAEDDALSARRAAIASALIERIIDPLEHEIVRIKAAQGLANPGLANPGLANPGLANPGLANPGLAGSRTIEALINVLADNEANGIGYNAHLALIKITTQKLPRRAASWRAWYKAAPPAGAGS